MINEIKIKFGSAPGQEHACMEATPITVFVGPNNSGKSKVLTEIHRFCSQGTKNVNDLILDELIFVGIDAADTDEKINSFKLKPNRNEALQPEHIVVGNHGSRQHVSVQNLTRALQQPNERTNRFCQWYLQYRTIILDGKNRINLVNQQGAGDLQNEPQSSFQVLFRDDDKRKEVRRIIEDAFGSYFVLDPTHLGQLKIKLSSIAPETDLLERGIHKEAVDFHAAAQPIEQASDGVKAFTGMITEIYSGDPEVLLIDEPEAFLHPPLSYKLGKEISEASVGTDKRIFVSTHSSNFVMGCIQSGAPVNIVRLTYRDGVPTARVLPNDDILRLMRNPLLRSTGVLEGLFYEFVIVTESDADRAFYQEINDRLLKYKPEWGIPNCLFLNAQNKQTVRTIIKPLRELGIPSAAIVDVDALKEGGQVWSSFLGCGFVPDISHQALAATRLAVKTKLEETGQNMKRDGGLSLLEGGDLEAANNLFDQLQEYGLFIIRGGELESWLPHLEATGHGPAWLVNVFEKMGEDPDSDVYLKPDDGDVWEFINGIRQWFINADRRGIPV